MAGENFGKFDEFGAIHQIFTHPNLYHKTVGRLKIHHDESIPSKYLKLVGNMYGQGSALVSSPLGFHINKRLALELVWPRKTTLQPICIFWITQFFFTRKLCSVTRSIPNSWCPLITLDTTNAHTNLMPHMMIK